MRVLLDTIPFDSPLRDWQGGGHWPAQWIRHPEALGVDPLVAAFRLRVTITEPRTVRLHVSADERYELYLDGVAVGRGPERGDVNNWFFETYDIPLAVGEHTVVAHTWWIGKMAAYAQMSHRPGFIVAAEGEAESTFNTGHAPWETVELGGYTFTHAGQAWGTGANLNMRGDGMKWGFESGDCDGWIAPVDIQQGRNRKNDNEAAPGWRLKPAVLPPMLEKRVHVGTVRHIDFLDASAIKPAGDDKPNAMMPPAERLAAAQQVKESDIIDRIDTADIVVDPALNLSGETSAWNRLLAGTGSVTIPAHTTLRAIVDLGNYYAAYPEITLSGGAGGAVRVEWAESLYIVGKHEKGNRNDVDGKRFFCGGVGDTFKHDGQDSRRYSTLWWQAGRYVQVIVVTGAEALTIDGFTLRETHYPYDVSSRFEASDSRIDAVTPIAIRAMEMCSHETYMDCPYYEQLMYVGDTRLEVLTTYAMTGDDRLPRKALSLFDWSRDTTGLTTSRYPCHTRQTIPPFSLWWIAMVHDYAFWRNDLDFVRTLMPGVRTVVDAYVGFLNSDGLVQGPKGWNFMDWVPSWGGGTPPDGQDGVSGVLNWHFVLALDLAAELERMMGEPELADRCDRYANSVAAKSMEVFFDVERGLLADDVAHTRWSEHSQCLALLSHRLPRDKRAVIADGLCTATDLEHTTIYFTHYLFEAYRMIRRPDLLFKRLELWFALDEGGFKTTFESPEPTRSDCHAWGAHPLFHYYATILGIRPQEPGFKELSIDPQLGPLTSASGTYPHPAGPVTVDVRRDGEKLTGSITLPEGVVGVLHLGKAIRVLQPGVQKF
ncbi:MAG TPA: alpha-L-rhamnosidase C-terminal domain-containing protein [Capsulimonadaceae bacterium]|jgi:hypothetical protein